MSVRDTIILTPKELRYLLIDSLRLYSDNVAFIDGNNPYRFSINKKTFYVHIKNVHESGENRTNPDECRIQVSKSVNFNEAIESFISAMVSVESSISTILNPSCSNSRLASTIRASAISGSMIRAPDAIPF